MGQTSLNPHRPALSVSFSFRNSPLLNGLNINLSNIAYSGKFSKIGEKKCLIRQKKKYSFKGSSSWSDILSVF